MTKPPTKNARIAIVEDDIFLLNYFVKTVSGVVTLDLAGAASSLLEAKRLIDSKPDLFLLDIGLPDGSGIDLIPYIRERIDTKILIITTFGDRETVVKAISSGADGYLLKDSDPEDIVDAIHVTLSGGAPISAAAAVYLLEEFRQTAQPPKEVLEKHETLTGRERELLNLFARGLTYSEAAGQMEISPLTVGTYVKRIYSKLAVHSRSEAIYEAVKTGQINL